MATPLNLLQKRESDDLYSDSKRTSLVSSEVVASVEEVESPYMKLFNQAWVSDSHNCVARSHLEWPTAKKSLTSSICCEEKSVPLFIHLDQQMSLHRAPYAPSASRVKKVTQAFEDDLSLPCAKKGSALAHKLFNCSPPVEDVTVSFLSHFDKLLLSDIQRHKVLIENALSFSHSNMPLSLRVRLPQLKEYEMISIEDATLTSSLDCLRDTLLKSIALVVTLNGCDEDKEDFTVLMNNHLCNLASNKKLEKLSLELRYEEGVVVSPSPCQYRLNLRSFAQLTHLNLMFCNQPYFNITDLETLNLDYFQVAFNTASPLPEIITYHKDQQTLDLSDTQTPYLSFSNMHEDDLYQFSTLSLLNTLREIRFTNITFTEQNHDQNKEEFNLIAPLIKVIFDCNKPRSEAHFLSRFFGI